MGLSLAESVAIVGHLPASSRQCLGVRGISKYFGDFAANRDVTISVDKGEIHALLGENGAGKSTLVKMIYGILKPDSGSMELLANPYCPDSPGDAKHSGVGMVFQHFAVFDALTVLENIALGLEGRLQTRHLQVRSQRFVVGIGCMSSLTVAFMTWVQAKDSE